MLPVYIYSFVIKVCINFADIIYDSDEACPSPFENLPINSKIRNDKSCYYISTKRTNWKTAKLQCEAKNSHLISVETLAEKTHILEYLLARHYQNSEKSNQINDSKDIKYEYWTSGSDMIQEGKWQWGKSRNLVGDVGWLRERKPESNTENCLSWTLTLITGIDNSLKVKEGWVSSWCLKNLFFICEL